MSIKELESSSRPSAARSPYYTEPEVKDVSERARLLREIVERMQSNPVPAQAPHQTREDLHARR